MPQPVRRGSQGSGQAMLEFALVVPIFMLIIVGLTDVGRAVFAYSVISNAAREGAREAILTYNQCQNTALCSTPASGTDLVGVNNSITRASGSTATFVFNDASTDTPTPPSCTPQPNQGCVWVFIANGNISGTTCTSPPGPNDAYGTCDFNKKKQSGNYDVVVEVEYNFVPLTPLVSGVLGGSTIMWAKSEMRTEY